MGENRLKKSKKKKERGQFNVMTQDGVDDQSPERTGSTASKESGDHSTMQMHCLVAVD